MKNNIKKFRNELHLSLQELSERCWVSNAQINRIEKNESEPTLFIAYKISYALKKNVYSVFPFSHFKEECKVFSIKRKVVSMNNERRKKLMRIVAELNVISRELEVVISEEQDALDNLPESLQDSSRAMDMEDNVTTLEEISSNVDDVISDIEDFFS